MLEDSPGPACWAMPGSDGASTHTPAMLCALLQERAVKQAAEQQAACTKAESEAAVSALDPLAQHAWHLRMASAHGICARHLRMA